MQQVVAMLVFLAAALAAPAGASAVTPVQKVLGLLGDMVAKGKSEKKAEQVQFAKYKAWCDFTSVEKQNAIDAGNKKIEELEAEVEKNEADARDFEVEIAVLDGDISTWEGDYKAATKVREIENIDYTKTHKDYTESIEALEKGVTTLKEQNIEIPQSSAALVQLKKATFLTPQAKSAIATFLAQDKGLSLSDDSAIVDENLAVAAPEAKAFESGLQGIIDMLEKLRGKFEDERTDLEKQETQDRHGYEMLCMDLKMQLEHANEARTEKSEAKASSLQGAADARGDLADTTTTRDDDQKFLQDMVATCDLKSSAFADRQTLRTAELEALQKAVDILSGGKVAGASEKYLPQLLQKKGGSSLAQLRADPASAQQRAVATYLKSQAEHLDSRVLSMLAEKVAADPFKKVKKMIKDLIVKLMEEAADEVETKGFCDKELATNEATRKEKTATVESLYADIDELGASIGVLTESMAKLAKELADMGRSVAAATANRQAEEAKNKATIQDAKDAQEAVSQAMTVLKEFYESAAESTALVQQKQPEIFDSPYKGMGAENGGIMGMIEVIGSDFMRLEAETNAEEESAAKEYQTFIDDSAVDKAQKSKDLDHLTEHKTSQEQALQEKKTDLLSTQKELDAAMSTYEKLKPTCLAAGSESYEERVAQRKEEIESLQEALRILNGEDIALAQQ